MPLLAMFWKELIQVANRKRFLLGKVLVVAGVAFMFVVVAFEEVYRDTSGTVFTRMSTFGRMFFLVSMPALTAVLSFVAMVTACGIVSSEVTRRRMPLLLVSPLGSGAIVGSKALAVFAQVLIGFVAVLPVFALLLIFGGVDSGMVMTASGFLLSNVWLYGCIGLAASVATANIIWSVSLATIALILWNILPLIAAILWEVNRTPAGPRSNTPPWYMINISPFYTYAMFAMARLPGRDLAYHIGVNAGLGSIFLGWAFRRFRPIALRRIAGAPTRKARRWSFGLPWRGAGKARSYFSVLSRRLEPGMISKELAASRKTRILLPLFWFALLYGFIIFISLVTGDRPDFGDKDLNVGLFVAESIGFLFMLSVFASTRFAAEKEAATLQTLALTRFGAARILAGKAMGVLIEQWLPLALVFLHLLFVVHLASDTSLYLAALGFALSVATSTAIGLYFSLAAKRIVEALSATAVMWFAGPYIVLIPVGIVSDMLNMGASSETMAVAALILSPVTVVVVLIAVRRAIKRGFGTVLAVTTYGFISTTAFLLVGAAFMDRGDNDAMAALSLLPSISTLPLDWRSNDIPVVMLLVPVQLGIFVWAVLSSLANFESQARKAA